MGSPGADEQEDDGRKFLEGAPEKLEFGPPRPRSVGDLPSAQIDYKGLVARPHPRSGLSYNPLDDLSPSKFWLFGKMAERLGTGSHLEAAGHDAMQGMSPGQRAMQNFAANAAEAAGQAQAQVEHAFGGWYANFADRMGLDRNPDHPRHRYDYRGYYQAIQEGRYEEAATGEHMPDEFKLPGHPTITGPGMQDRIAAARGVVASLSEPEEGAEREDLKFPGLKEIAVATLGAFLAPRFAGDILASPFEARLERREERFEEESRARAIREQGRVAELGAARGELSDLQREQAQQQQNQLRVDLAALADADIGMRQATTGTEYLTRGTDYNRARQDLGMPPIPTSVLEQRAAEVDAGKLESKLQKGIDDHAAITSEVIRTVQLRGGPLTAADVARLNSRIEAFNKVYPQMALPKISAKDYAGVLPSVEQAQARLDLAERREFRLTVAQGWREISGSDNADLIFDTLKKMKGAMNAAFGEDAFVDPLLSQPDERLRQEAERMAKDAEYRRTILQARAELTPLQKESMELANALRRIEEKYQSDPAIQQARKDRAIRLAKADEGALGDIEKIELGALTRSSLEWRAYADERGELHRQTQDPALSEEAHWTAFWELVRVEGLDRDYFGYQWQKGEAQITKAQGATFRQRQLDFINDMGRLIRHARATADNYEAGARAVGGGAPLPSNLVAPPGGAEPPVSGPVKTAADLFPAQRGG